MKVALVEASDYAGDLDDQIIKLTDHLGGLFSFITPGSKVLLKPNLVFNQKPEEAATTHPSVIGALIRILRAHQCEVWVGDSPFIGKTKRWFDKTAIAKVTRQNGGHVANFAKTVDVGCDTARMVHSFPLAKESQDVDFIINCPKLKTHKQLVFTAATKNNYGLIVGPFKGMLHMKMQTKERFGHMLVDLLQSCTPTLNILDGIIGMEGDGPGSGQPRAMGLLGASACALSLDYVCAGLIGLDPWDVPYLSAARHRADIEFNTEAIDVVGDAIASQDFVKANEMLINFMPKWMGRFGSIFPELSA